MALNLGFSGFRRGSYDFYKSDWKYLNDSMTRGSIAAANTSQIRGVLIPAGVSSVYDEQLGKNLSDLSCILDTGLLKLMIEE